MGIEAPVLPHQSGVDEVGREAEKWRVNPVLFCDGTTGCVLQIYRLLVPRYVWGAWKRKAGDQLHVESIRGIGGDRAELAESVEDEMMKKDEGEMMK